MPAPNEGQFKIMLREPLPKDGDRAGGSGNTRPAPSFDADLDDDVGF